MNDIQAHKPRSVVSGIQTVVDELNVEDPESVSMTAQTIHNKAQAKSVIRGQDEDIIYAAAVYIACKIETIPLRPQEIAQASNINLNSLFRVNRMLIRDLSLSVPPVPTRVYIKRYCSEIEVSEETCNLALDIHNACSGEFSSATPTALASSAIYAASNMTGEKLTQNEVSDATGVSEVTIRNWYTKQISEYEGTS